MREKRFHEHGLKKAREKNEDRGWHKTKRVKETKEDMTEILG